MPVAFKEDLFWLHKKVVSPETLKRAVDSLPDRCRTIFLMAREEGLKYKEIAQTLSISEKTVNAQMVLAIRKLSDRLGGIIHEKRL